MTTGIAVSLCGMFRAFPLRTLLFTFGPLVVGLAQTWNALVNGRYLWPVVAVAALTFAFSVVVTRYHLASFRRQSLLRECN